jgi:hypothetical protein
VVGRASETLEHESESFPSIAATAVPGEPASALAEGVATARREIRNAFDAVVEAGSIRALCALPPECCS